MHFSLFGKDKNKKQIQSSKEAVNLNKGRKRILVVDDDQSIVKLIRACLDFTGYITEQELRLDNVSHTISVFDPDLIILDVMMPSERGDSGSDVCLRLKNDPIYASIKIILCTAIARGTNLTEETLKERTRADGVIFKPFQPADLVKMVKRILR